MGPYDELRRTVDPEAATERIMRQQLKDFRKKFGRDPLPGEPVFFDPVASVPTATSEAKWRQEMLEVLSDLPPQFAYAYAKSGPLLLLEQQVEHYSGWRARRECGRLFQRYWNRRPAPYHLPANGNDVHADVSRAQQWRRPRQDRRCRKLVEWGVTLEEYVAVREVETCVVTHIVGSTDACPYPIAVGILHEPRGSTSDR